MPCQGEEASEADGCPKAGPDWYVVSNAALISGVWICNPMHIWEFKPLVGSVVNDLHPVLLVIETLFKGLMDGPSKAHLRSYVQAAAANTGTPYLASQEAPLLSKKTGRFKEKLVY